MQAVSAATRITDPFRAGVTLGRSLADIAPSTVFLFCTVNYDPPEMLLAGLHSVLATPELRVVGNTGDGCLERSGQVDYGAVALGLSTSAAVRWADASAAGLERDPRSATRAAYAQLCARLGGKPGLVFACADFRTDASEIEQVLHDEIDVPVIGGLAADDNRMLRCAVFHGTEVLEDAIVLLGTAGSLAFDIGLSGGRSLTPVGRIARVDAAEGTRLYRIDGIPAMDFIERETGKPVLQSDRGIVALMVSDAQHPQRRRLRSIVPDFSLDVGTVGLYGGIAAGDSVQVCIADTAGLSAEVECLARRIERLDFLPRAGLVVSCNGRKWLHSGRLDHEVRRVVEAIPEPFALVGYPSFGEIAPVREGERYGPNYFHNMTHVQLLLGERA